MVTNDAVRRLVDALAERGLTVAAAESCTGGLLSGALTAVPGASRWFVGGVVAYENRVKEELLGVDRDVIASHGAVSRDVALAMADGVRRRFGVDIGISTTGIAGPDGGTASKPVGTVWIGIADRGGCRAYHFRFEGDRDSVRGAAVVQAIGILASTAEGGDG